VNQHRHTGFLSRKTSGDESKAKGQGTVGNDSCPMMAAGPATVSRQAPPGENERELRHSWSGNTP
jgi:hypothetical protein